jgi:hypothetical protein
LSPLRGALLVALGFVDDFLQARDEIPKSADDGARIVAAADNRIHEPKRRR